MVYVQYDPTNGFVAEFVFVMHFYHFRRALSVTFNLWLPL